MIKSRQIDTGKIIFLDEAHFWLDGYVNRQNYRIWGSEKPSVTVTKPLHPEKISAWCGLSSEGIIGPYLLDTSVDAAVYQELLTSRFFPDARERKLMTKQHWFQQDGAPAHTAKSSLELIRSCYGGRVISDKYPEAFKEGLIWPPYSSDLSPLDFFLWGYVEDEIYQKPIKDLESLARAVADTLEAVTPEMCERTLV